MNTDKRDFSGFQMKFYQENNVHPRLHLHRTAFGAVQVSVVNFDLRNTLLDNQAACFLAK